MSVRSPSFGSSTARSTTLDVEVLDELATVVDDLAGSHRRSSSPGNGRVFSAGADLKRVLEGGADYVAAFIAALHRTFLTLFRCRRPTVAAVDGAAIAGGCIIAAACDHRLMAEGPARIGANELTVGVPFPAAAIEVMHHACGHRTGDLVLRARLLDVYEAIGADLVHEAVAPERLVERAVEVATRAGGTAERGVRDGQAAPAPRLDRPHRARLAGRRSDSGAHLGVGGDVGPHRRSARARARMTGEPMTPLPSAKAFAEDERSVLFGYLDYHRAVLARKAEGIS